MDPKHSSADTPAAPASTLLKIVKVLGVLFCLWAFLVGLELMGSAFKVMGGHSAGNMFRWVSDPIVGLMVGILATVLVQSSSTSTSVVVGLVGSGIMDVPTAIPVIMGANIGTSVTSTLVSMGQVGDMEEFQRAFAGATVHDMFNYMSVAVLLPIEIITSGFNGGNGGFLWAVSKGLADALAGSSAETFKSPIKIIASPIADEFVKVDKDKIKALSMGAPTLASCLGTASKPTKVAKISYYVCGNQTLLDASLKAWDEKIVHGSLVKAGVFEGDDTAGGIVTLILSLLVLCGALYGIVKLLKSLVMSGEQGEGSLIYRALNMNGFMAILVGALMTICVQSSSIITSTLVPLVGLGTLTLEGMLPLTLGANIGTTCTALLAAVASGKVAGLQIALCHLMFNICGILIFYPVPFMRRLPIKAATGLGYLTVAIKLFPVIYIGVAFLLLPLLCLAIGQCINSSDAGLVGFGIFLVIIVIGVGVGFIVWYKTKGGKAKISEYLETKYNARKADSSKISPENPPVISANPPVKADVALEVV